MAIDLKKLLAQPGIEKIAPRPCPKCGERDCGGPCYGYDCSTHDGPDFDCSAEITQDCDDCFYVWCDDCKLVLVGALLPGWRVHKSTEPNHDEAGEFSAK